MDGFKIKDGRGAYHVDLDDPQWFIPNNLPFGCGCCKCGEYHQVHYRETNECFGFMLKVEEDKEETKRLQEYILAHPKEYPENKLQTIAALTSEVERLREALGLLINFIPEGWPMPFGWNQVVAQARKAMEGRDERSDMPEV